MVSVGLKGFFNKALNFIMGIDLLGLGVVLGIILLWKNNFFAKLFGSHLTLDISENYHLPPTSLSSSMASQIATRLYDAMSSMGTNEQSIYDIFIGLSINDGVAVYNAFGLRQYSKFWGNVGDPLTSEKHPLSVWLNNELSTSSQAYQAAYAVLSPSNLI